MEGAVLLKFKEAKSEISETEKAIEKGGDSLHDGKIDSNIITLQ
jgi:hypothetical protein